MAEKSQEVELCGEIHENVRAGWISHRPGLHFDVVTSLPHEDASHRLMILSIVDSDCQPGGELVGQTFFLEHYIVHPVELRDEETGEITEALRLILPQPSGPPISFVSTGVIKSIQRLAWAVGKEPPFQPPLKVRLKQRALKGGKRSFNLVLAE